MIHDNYMRGIEFYDFAVLVVLIPRNVFSRADFFWLFVLSVIVLPKTDNQLKKFLACVGTPMDAEVTSGLYSARR